MKTYSFEKMDTWIKARELAVFTYQITKTFPKSETFGLCSQMRRAAISVCSNIVEGNAKYSAREKARFTEISYASLMELLNQAIISQDMDYISDKNMDHFRLVVDDVSNLLIGLRKSQLSMQSSPHP